MSEEDEMSGILGILREKMPDPDVSLVRLPSPGRSHAYRATSRGRSWFVKYPDESSRMYALLRVSDGCPYLPQSLFERPIPFADGYVTCLEWRPSEFVPVERWSESQLESFLSAYAAFARVLERTPDIGQPEDDAAYFAEILAYAKRHPIAARLLRPLVALPPEERTYRPGERLAVTHGDLHGRNYGFSGESFDCFYDLDNILAGYATEDLAYTVLDRAQRRSVSRRHFRRCVEALRRMMARFGRPTREWRVAINRKRVRQAASKIARRPDSLIPAIDICLRDRRAIRLMREAGMEG